MPRPRASLLLCLALAQGRTCGADGTLQPPPVVPFGERGELHVCSSSIVRVTHRPTSAPVAKESLIAKPLWAPVKYTARQQGDLVVVETSELTVTAEVSTGRVTFFRASGARGGADGEPVLKEGGTSFTPMKDMDKDTFEVEQSWATTAGESIYGGGGYQNGLLDYKHAPLQMIQYNSEAVVPFFHSSEGYGLLWDNYARTFLNPPDTPLVAPTNARNGRKVNGAVDFTPSRDGDHFFYWGATIPKGTESPTWGSGGSVKVHLEDADGAVVASVMDWDGLYSFPSSLLGRAEGLKAGTKYKVVYSWTAHPRGLFVQGPELGKTSLRSSVGELVDYYFVLGLGDKAIAGYREITGAAPLYSRWAYGFWQCKEHYDTQAHLLEAAHGFRNYSIPVDSIVQDWLYWGSLGWGPHWDPATYPDPAAMVSELKSLDMHIMVSVWSKFDPKTEFYKQMKARGFLLRDSNVYDAWNPEARELFYNFSKAADFSIGVDSLWLDATEPEYFPNVNSETYLGSGNALMNSFSLMTTQAIADGLRRDYADAQGARVFSLTRSSFAGQQRTGAALWSGDISGCWDSLRRQVASSLNYALSGMPYWSEDIGGFFRPKDQYDSADYHDLLTRWFQFGAFTPIFRVHGSGTKTELWNFGEETMRNINVSAIGLRYRLLPYTYSGFARVEHEGYTMQRALVLDFPADRSARQVADEFMWGDSLLVAPIHVRSDPKCACTARQVYLPEAAKWVNFHTGESHPSGTSQATFKLIEAPLFVRAGSLVVMGPLLQRASHASPTDPLEVRVYPGANARFTLFEDDGVSLAYQRGDFAAVDFEWDDAKGELAVGAVRGRAPPALAQGRLLSVVFVRPGHGGGLQPRSAPDAAVRYVGEPLVVRRPGMQATIWT